MTTWLQHVKQVHSKGSTSFKESLKRASASWKKTKGATAAKKPAKKRGRKKKAAPEAEAEAEQPEAEPEPKPKKNADGERRGRYPPVPTKMSTHETSDVAGFPGPRPAGPPLPDPAALVPAFAGQPEAPVRGSSAAAASGWCNSISSIKYTFRGSQKATRCHPGVKASLL